MILTHGDNRGLVIPPRVAEKQVVLIPVGVTAKYVYLLTFHFLRLTTHYRTTPEARESLYGKVTQMADDLESVGVRVEVDLREGYSPGWK